MKTLVTAVVLACVVGSPMAAQTSAPAPVRSAWQWTDDERLAARFAPGRVAALLGPDGRSALARPGAARFRDVVDGAQEPQLFLPLEVFGHFVLVLFRPGAPPASVMEQHQLEDLFARIDRAGLPAGFREVLARETAHYVGLQVKYQASTADLLARRPRRGDQEIDTALQTGFRRASREHCQALYKALAGVHRSLGEPSFHTFLDFLYREVAPQMAVQYESNEVSHEGELRVVAGGCQ